jgi:hypothetical protein
MSEMFSTFTSSTSSLIQIEKASSWKQFLMFSHGVRGHFPKEATGGFCSQFPVKAGAGGLACVKFGTAKHEPVIFGEYKSMARHVLPQLILV